MIRAMINKKLKDVNIEELKQNDYIYYLFLNKMIEYIEDNCDYFGLDKSVAYIHLGKLLYEKKEKTNEDSKTNGI